MDRYDGRPFNSTAIVKEAKLLAVAGEPAFVLGALAAGFNNEQIRRMQCQMEVATGLHSYLCAVNINGDFMVYWPMSIHRIGDSDWVYNLVTREFNPSWQSFWSNR